MSSELELPKGCERFDSPPLLRRWPHCENGLARTPLADQEVVSYFALLSI
jgi:hypothetical protein